jgi:hypothetical protein
MLPLPAPGRCAAPPAGSAAAAAAAAASSSVAGLRAARRQALPY